MAIDQGDRDRPHDAGGYADHSHRSGGTQSSLGATRRFDQHGGQSGNQWQGHGVGGSGGPMGGSYFGGGHGGGFAGPAGGNMPGGAGDPNLGPSGFDQQRYGQQGLGSWGGTHDDHAYRNWRDQQMRAFDLEYEEFRRHRQERFAAEFDEWRRSRGGPGSAAAVGRPQAGDRPIPDDSGGLK